MGEGVRMKKSLILGALLSASVAMPSAAAACDLHGSGVFGGMHRFNPFAKAMPLDRALDRPAQSTAPYESAPVAAEAERQRAEKKQAEDRAREARSEIAVRIRLVVQSKRLKHWDRLKGTTVRALERGHETFGSLYWSFLW